MSTVFAPKERLLTVEEFDAMPSDGRLLELVEGRVVELPRPTPQHGKVCLNAARAIGRYLDQHDAGHLVGNDSGVITRREPDSLRGPDVAFFSYSRVPKGKFPKGFVAVLPELAIEVKSENDRWPYVLKKVAEYLAAGVQTVCVLDPEEERVYVYTEDKPVRILSGSEELELPSILPGFKCRVDQLFC